jgi:hypothetical protein
VLLEVLQKIFKKGKGKGSENIWSYLSFSGITKIITATLSELLKRQFPPEKPPKERR